jgi:hypothetical protein
MVAANPSQSVKFKIAIYVLEIVSTHAEFVPMDSSWVKTLSVHLIDA